jgi:hypothetical protein
LVCSIAEAAQQYQQHLLKLLFIKYFFGHSAIIVGTLGYLPALHTNKGSETPPHLSLLHFCGRSYLRHWGKIKYRILNQTPLQYDTMPGYTEFYLIDITGAY